MNRVRLKKVVHPRDLPSTSPTITHDLLGRIASVVLIYTSFKVTMTPVWVGETNTLSTYTTSVEDL